MSKILSNKEAESFSQYEIAAIRTQLMKEAGVMNDMLSVAVAIMLLGGSISEAAEKTNISQDKIAAAMQDQNTVNTVRKAIAPKKDEQLTDKDKVARTIYAEARGESSEGKKAVASVIWNRAGGDVGKLAKVVTAPKQFSCWNSGTPAAGSGAAWNECVRLAEDLVSGSFTPSGNWNHYFNPKLANPKWAKGKTGQDIGNHRFLKL